MARGKFARELKWLGAGFGLPFIAILAFDLLTSRSPMPVWKRILSIEDVCAHALCIVLPLVVSIPARIRRSLTTSTRGTSATTWRGG